MRGDPAKCHPEHKETARGLCRTCYRTWQMSQLTTEGQDAFKQKGKLDARIWMLARRTKRPTPEVRKEVESILSEQAACEICKTTDNLCLDHDHKTGKVRGLLCRHHNFLIAFAQENEDILHNAVRYLHKIEEEASCD